MAPMRVHHGNVSDPNRPFVDYFWIAGLDSQDLLDFYHLEASRLGSSLQHDGLPNRNTSVISDGVLAEEDEASSIVESPVLEQEKSRPNSYQRLSKLSNEARRSIQSIDTIANLHSNRSSGTIRPKVSPAVLPPVIRTSTALSDADFDTALKKFATDRDTFFLSLDFRNDTPKSSPSKVKPRTQRIVPEDLEVSVPNRTMGSIRRHMSFRDMNSVRRQPSVAARRVSTRSSRRISTYNAVIPQPEHIRVKPNQHPLKHRFEPVLLDRYPRPDMSDQLLRRNAFPDFVPMFAFPNDVQVISSDTRPPATWHEFSMTASDSSRVPAVCIVLWIPMSNEAADELEKLCEAWRKANLSDAERELAASLAERLAIERAKLSTLLSKLPQATQGSDEREELEDEISAVEEKINLMSDMLRPLRHGAANRIKGLTDGDTGLWIPRAYGILGSDESMNAVWKEWLKAIVVPMMDGAVLRIPASSPRVGMWQPLERYVLNVCCEAQLPTSSKTQTEITIRELKLYAKKEAINELPGSRSTDLYPLFRALTIPNIMVLFEYMLTEERIVLVSSHVAMLKLASQALIQLLWPFEWAGIYIPVLPARLVQVLEAPCPYICGVLRKGDKLELPDDNFVVVDLDKNEIHASEQPPPIPKQQRRKLMSLLHLAAPHHHSRGVPVGPPGYAIEAFPNDTFPSAHASVFSPAIAHPSLPKLASLSSAMFGSQAASEQAKKALILNAFSQSKPISGGFNQPTTASAARRPSYPDSEAASPMTANFPPTPRTPISRSESGHVLQTSLRDKRSGYVDSFAKSSDTFSNLRRKASLPFVRHVSSPSIISVSVSPLSEGVRVYAPSSYAQSTLAASTVMPGVSIQPARNTETQIWVEGHCLLWQSSTGPTSCSICEEKIDGNLYCCSSCDLKVHGHCGTQLSIVCQAAFYPDQVRAAFARFFTSLLYSYKKFSSVGLNRNGDPTCKINVEAWMRSLGPEHAAYIDVLKETQALNEFVAEREDVTNARQSNSVRLFDALLSAKRGRSGRIRPSMSSMGFGRNPFGRSSGSDSMDFLTDSSSHIWRLVSFAVDSDRPDLSRAAQGRDYHSIISRAPAKLEDGFLEKPTRKERQPTTTPDKITLLKRRMNGLSMNAP